MIVTITYDVCGDIDAASHTAPRVTCRLRGSGVATVTEYGENGAQLRRVHYRSAWIITRTKEETPRDHQG